jgi:hypothetical protein
MANDASPDISPERGVMAFELRGSLRSRAKPIAGLLARSADANCQQIGRQHPRRPAD